eukprot:m.260982 g.260982  ORF g.260982 m.260982 type:complete len:148 (-) comp54607_c3_seq22:792-1235(-)
MMSCETHSVSCKPWVKILMEALLWFLPCRDSVFNLLVLLDMGTHTAGNPAPATDTLAVSRSTATRTVAIRTMVIRTVATPTTATPTPVMAIRTTIPAMRTLTAVLRFLLLRTPKIPSLIEVFCLAASYSTPNDTRCIQTFIPREAAS